MKAVGFNQGQFGDVVMGMIAAKAFKRDNPYDELYLGINKKYASIAPLFENNPLIDGIHIWDQYNDWPSMEDRIAASKFDKVFNAMPQHTRGDWYNHIHQTEELCLMHDLQPPFNLQIELVKYFPVKQIKGRIGVCLFGETRSRDKNPSVEKAIRLTSMLQDLGYEVIQIGLKDDPQVAPKYEGDFFGAVKTALMCDVVICVDTALAWILSGYKHPVVGLYGFNYYPGAKTSRNWQPVNPNAIYLEAPRVEEINEEHIIKAVKLRT